jgi:S-DNA-T family DNA segregation ATPase FtsK/SpoIIIE
MEVRRIVKHLKEIAEPRFHPELTQLGRSEGCEMPRDELFDQAAQTVLETRRGSVSLLQRRLSIGYARASRIIEMMAASGILGEYKGSQAREVLMTLEEYQNLRDRESEEEQEDFGNTENNEKEDYNTLDNSGSAYVNEGQRGYISVDNEME